MTKDDIEPIEMATDPNPDPSPEIVEKNGRDAFIEKYRSYHPDSPDELDDNDLWDYAGNSLNERDDYLGKYTQLNESNEKLAQVVSEHPEVAQFISMIANGEPPLYAIGVSFGNIEDKIDEASLEQLRKGQAEYKKEIDRIKANMDNYRGTLKQYGETHGLSEEDLSNINNTILDIAEALREGDIPEEVIDNIWKGMDYESATEANIEAAKLAGRNEAIEEVKSKKQPSTLPPDISNRQSQASPTPKRTQPNNSTFVDVLADSELI